MSDKKTNILIAEDEKPMARALSLKLQHEGFNVIVAYDGEEAIKIIDSTDLDLIILDIIMPKKTGFDVLEHIQQTGKKTPAMIASNLSQEEDVAKAKKLGAKDYFVKADTPIHDLIQKIKHILKEDGTQ